MCCRGEIIPGHTTVLSGYPGVVAYSGACSLPCCQVWFPANSIRLSQEVRYQPTAGYQSFGPMARCVVHALKGLACRARVTPVSLPAAPASRARRSRSLRSTLAAAPGLRAHAHSLSILRSSNRLVLTGDDFYQISSGLIVLETTIGNGNQSLFTEYTTPTCVLEYTRNIVANRLAT